MTDVGNICRCICGDVQQENTTILVPAARGCELCNTEVCVDYFARCAEADNLGLTVTVHCIDRNAIAPRLAISVLVVLVAVLLFVAANKDRSRFLRRVYDACRGDA